MHSAKCCRHIRRVVHKRIFHDLINVPVQVGRHCGLKALSIERTQLGKGFDELFDCCGTVCFLFLPEGIVQCIMLRMYGAYSLIKEPYRMRCPPIS